MTNHKLAIIGASGYSGAELVRLLLMHPEVELNTLMTSNQERTDFRRYCDELPQFQKRCELKIEPLNFKLLKERGVSLIFLATPHQVAHQLVPQLLQQQLRVIDLSGAFRLKDAGLYSPWYGFTHEYPNDLKTAVYGLTETHRTSIKKATLLANPGCYSTAALLPIIPLQRAGLIEPNTDIICDSKSGVTGAGKSPSATTHFSEVAESFKGYNIWQHRHSPEIWQELGHSHLIFTAHLLPINRGILSTIYIKVVESTEPSAIAACFKNTYGQEPMIRLFPEDSFPEVKHVSYTNYCDIGWKQSGSNLIILSAIDNLGKGAAGQAIQNMNVMLGLKETLGVL